MKRDDPAHDIVVYERGPRNATWGFGVVFSDRALEFLRADDEDHATSTSRRTWRPGRNLTIQVNDTPHPHRRQRLRRHRPAGDAEPAVCPCGIAGRAHRIRQRHRFAGPRCRMPTWSSPPTARSPGCATRTRTSSAPITDWRPQQLHLVRHQQAFRQPVADFPRNPTRRVLRPPLPLQPAHEHLPGRSGRRHLAARRLRVHEPRGHHPPLRAGLRQRPGRPSDTVQQLATGASSRRSGTSAGASTTWC